MKNKKLIVIFYSAVAFFFLFFLHGFSIGKRQQGISYNALEIADGRCGFGGTTKVKQWTAVEGNRRLLAISLLPAVRAM